MYQNVCSASVGGRWVLRRFCFLFGGRASRKAEHGGCAVTQGLAKSTEENSYYGELLRRHKIVFEAPKRAAGG